jgi:segregation and condensation protein A
LNQENFTDTPDLTAPPIRVGEALLADLPTDLYIPPDALQVFLSSFEGPLDLLLYLIQRQNLDILNIPIAEVTRQYLHYIELMQELRLDLAAEYLVMAAVLVEIKSRLLLPVHKANKQDNAEDPRIELVRQLEEYARYKKAAQALSIMPQVGRDVFLARVESPDIAREREIPPVSLSALLYAMQGVTERLTLYTSHQIAREPLSVRERMSHIISELAQGEQLEFSQLFTITEGRAGAVVTLLAVLELVREAVIRLSQHDAFAPIYLNLISTPETVKSS